jgi:hypothetical protein
MFDFLHRKSIPPLRPDNPGDVAFVDHRTAGTGQLLRLDLTAMLQQVLASENIRSKARKQALELKNGLILQPRYLDCESHPNGMRTATTIQVDHPRLVPEGLFEFQHAWAPDFEQSLQQGFVQWARTDLATLGDALLHDPEHSMAMRFDLADGRARRAMFGPFTHFLTHPPAPGTAEAEEIEKFCPCCLFTNAIDGLKPLLERSVTIGLRLFASRDAKGAQADCRVNGIEYPDGADALRAYADTWLPKGDFEFRRQYVLLHDFPCH